MQLPLSLRFGLTTNWQRRRFENGKHVFVEKPFTSTSAQGEELINLAAQKNLKIMVDHTFLFTGAVKKISQLLDEGALGICTTTIPPASTLGSSNTIERALGPCAA